MGSISVPSMRPRYRHHQDSVVSSTETYDDFLDNASNAKPVASQKTVNGQVVSTVRGGCYTTPYYYYTHPESSYTVACDGGYHQEGYATRPDVEGSYPVYVCNDCGYRQVGGEWSGHTRTVNNPAYNTYGTSVASGGSIIATYYLKTCGHMNGEVLSVHKRAYIATS